MFATRVPLGLSFGKVWCQEWKSRPGTKSSPKFTKRCGIAPAHCLLSCLPCIWRLAVAAKAGATAAVATAVVVAAAAVRLLLSTMTLSAAGLASNPSEVLLAAAAATAAMD